MPWLMKAEPDSRVVKGKDVKFSVDDFEALGTSPWDGVRNHEAKNIMKDRMKLGDQVLFYHSNCKVPGVYALAEVAKEGYPDYTAWDAAHPYYDPKSSADKPTWYMVSVKFTRRLAHPVTLAAIKQLAAAAEPAPAAALVGAHGLAAVRAMALVNRGRLSVQPVEQAAYDAIVALGDWPGDASAQPAEPAKPADASKAAEAAKTAKAGKAGKAAKAAKAGTKPGARRGGPEAADADAAGDTAAGDEASGRPAKRARKGQAGVAAPAPTAGTRRSARRK